MVVRYCTNCAHHTKPEDVYPCIKCAILKRLDLWEPNEEGDQLLRNCDTCKHMRLPHYKAPCKICLDRIGYPLWEPKEDIKDMDLVKK